MQCSLFNTACVFDVEIDLTQRPPTNRWLSPWEPLELQTKSQLDLVVVVLNSSKHSSNRYWIFWKYGDFISRILVIECSLNMLRYFCRSVHPSVRIGSSGLRHRPTSLLPMPRHTVLSRVFERLWRHDTCLWRAKPLINRVSSWRKWWRHDVIMLLCSVLTQCGWSRVGAFDCKVHRIQLNSWFL